MTTGLTAAAFALLLAATAPALGQQAGPQEPGASPEPPGSHPPAGADSYDPFQGLSGEDFIGRTVHSSDGEEVGRVERLVIAEGAEQPELLVGVGGFFGLFERLVTIPLDLVRVDGDRLVAGMTEDEIGGLHPYQAGRYRDWDRPHSPRASPPAPNPGDTQ